MPVKTTTSPSRNIAQMAASGTPPPVAAEPSGVLDQALAATERAHMPAASTTAPRISGIVIGDVVEVAPDGTPRVTHPAAASAAAVPATSAVEITTEHAGRQVALAFERGDPERPIILGLIHDPQPCPPADAAAAMDAAGKPLDVHVDGERITLSAEKEIVLRCGKASITLTRAGKVLIRGAYLLSRSSGVNRIKGGSVQVN
jgi:hypothetical protein